MNWTNPSPHTYHTELTGGRIVHTIPNRSINRSRELHRYRLQVYFSENSLSHHQFVIDVEKTVSDDTLLTLWTSFKLKCDAMEKMAKEIVG
jgi:hypothetical protein